MMHKLNPATMSVAIAIVIILLISLVRGTGAQSPCGPEPSWEAPRHMAPQLGVPMRGDDFKTPMACQRIGNAEFCY